MSKGNQELAVAMPTAPAAVSLGTLQAASPSALVAGASEMANALAGLIKSQGLSNRIQGREYVRVEGWTTLGVMLGVVAREVETVEDAGIYTATVELVRLSDGAVISRASAECGEEAPWNKRPKYARRSMAQTRATGKACRLAFSWIMALAGYEATPAEEMEPVEYAKHQHESPQPEPAGYSHPTRPAGGPNGSGPVPSGKNGTPISEAQHKRLEARINELGLDRERVKSWVSRTFGIEHLNQLTRNQYADLDGRLEGWAERAAVQEEGR